MDAETLPAGRELDALVAEKVMGWDIHFRDRKFRGGIEHWRDPENSTLLLPDQYCPSSDIALAWQVVRKMSPRELFISREEGRGWNVRFMPATNDGLSGGSAVGCETAALAICRAALRCVGA